MPFVIIGVAPDYKGGATLAITIGIGIPISGGCVRISKIIVARGGHGRAGHGHPGRGVWGRGILDCSS